MNILSLCSGYGGLDLAAEYSYRAKTKWVCEIDADASTVLTNRFPQAINLGDLKSINCDYLSGHVDIITAGYPCQPFSTAGKRRGTTDERHLWPWIANTISAVRPETVVLENVQGHLRLGFADVLADLAAMGRTARWGIVRASDAGAPHRRARLFVVSKLARAVATYPSGSPCYLGITCGRTAELAEGEIGRTISKPPADTDSSGSQRTEPEERRELLVRSVAADADGQPGDATGNPGRDSRTDWGKFAFAIQRWERQIRRDVPTPMVDGSRQLNARFVEWMMGLPQGWVTNLVPNRRALRVLGNGVVPQQAALALNLLDH